MRGFIDIRVGDDVVRVTAWNPSTDLTLLKCAWLVSLIRRALPAMFVESEFRAWLADQPGGVDVLNALRDGWIPPRRDPLKVDPLNIGSELAIIRSIAREQQQGKCGTQKQDGKQGGCGCGRSTS